MFLSISIDIPDYVGVAILVAVWFYMKSRRAKNRKIEEMIVA